MQNKYLIGGVCALSILLLFFASLSLGGIAPFESSNTNSQGIQYHSSVCVYKNNELIAPCNHNVVYNTGLELIEDFVADGSSTDACDWIELGNASVAAGEPQADSSEAYTALDGGCFTGTNPVAGTVYDNGNGNWTIGTTFTSSCGGVLTNVTHLLNDADAEFAGANFTLVTLQSSDTVAINWTIWATSS